MVVYGGDKKVAPRCPSLGQLVGQDELVGALEVVATNDDLGGLLIRGAKGTAKSTAVRGLQEVLPAQTAVADCHYGCPPEGPGAQCAACRERTDLPTEERPVPLVTLPLGATRDRLVGSLSVADALDGDYEFEPGLLARANRGVLYVDEVNLLDDHLVDLLLDAAASGRNRVERDGVSVEHPAAFTLVGTMNPEEGELRPQLKDRFDLQVEVEGCSDPGERAAIVRQSLGEDNRDGSAELDPDTADIASRLHDARERLDTVTLPEDRLEQVVTLCRDAGVEGHRGDIATARAARTLAALDRRSAVTEGDVRTAARLALGHRLTARPFEDDPDLDDVLDEHLDESGADSADDDGDSDGDGGDEDDAGGEEPGGSTGDGTTAEEPGGDREGSGEEAGDGSNDSAPADRDGSDQSGPERERGGANDGQPDRGGDGVPDSAPAGLGDGDQDGSPESDGGDDAGAGDQGEHGAAAPIPPGGETADIGRADAPDVPDLTTVVSEDQADAAGSARTTTAEPGADGPRVRTRPAEEGDRVDLAASVRAGASADESGVAERDLRASVRETAATALVTFVVDASASMRPAMRAAKGTVMTLLEDAYEGRDAVAFVAVAGDDAEVLLPPTDSVTLAARHLKDLPTGDRTPLPDGLATAAEVIERADPAHSVVVVVTDGKANVAEGSPTAATRETGQLLAGTDSSVVVVDAGDDGYGGVLEELVAATDARTLPLSSLTAERVDETVRASRR